MIDAAHPAFALGDVTLTLPNGVHPGDASSLEDDEKLFPFQGLAGQATLVVGDDLVDITAAQSVEQGLALRRLHRWVGSRKVVVDEGPDLGLGPQLVG
jgi:3-deoxy-D-manno-octulosonate 8-phosphate phosphatase KdsC-like HAD superfamily phosphatase